VALARNEIRATHKMVSLYRELPQPIHAARPTRGTTSSTAILQNSTDLERSGVESLFFRVFRRTPGMTSPEASGVR
jgi:hypothetical protein